MLNESFSNLSRWVLAQSNPGTFNITQNGLIIPKVSSAIDPLTKWSISAKLNEFSNIGLSLIIQYSVLFSDFFNISSNWATIGLYSKSFDQVSYNSTTSNWLIFGPQPNPGYPVVFRMWLRLFFNNNKSSLAFVLNSSYFQINVQHTYKLKLNPDNTYLIYVDNDLVKNGSIFTDILKSPQPAAANSSLAYSCSSINYVGFGNYVKDAGIAYDKILIYTTPFA
jgi:hypothetical protein